MVPLTGTGGYFTRLGHLIKMLQVCNTYRGTTLPGLVATMASDLASNDFSDASTLVTSLGTEQTASQSFTNTLQNLASNITITMASADSAQPTNSNFTSAFNYIKNQMIGASQTVQRNTVSESISASGSNIGNPILVASMLDSNGLPCEYAFAEPLIGTCSGDSQSGRATAFSEPFSFLGTQSVNQTTLWNYPAGSGSTFSLTSINPLLSQQASGNMLNNSDFETFTVANTPNSWAVLVGTPGTQILQVTSGVGIYSGSSSLSFVGDGSTLTGIYQIFGTGTSVTLAPSTAYAFECQFRLTSVPASGTVRVALTDGSNTVTMDNSSNSNSASLVLSSASASTWITLSGVFRTPKLLPATGFRFQVALTSELSSGSTLYIDHLGFTPASQPYFGGPLMALFAGNVAPIVGDSTTLTVTNSRNGLIQSGFDALLPMRNNKLILPSAASSPTISDSLVA